MYYSSRGQKSNRGCLGLKSRCWQGWVPSEGSRLESTSLPFPAPRSCLLSKCCVAPPPSSKPAARGIFNSFSLSLTSASLVTCPYLTLTLLPSSYKDPYDSTSPTRVIQNLSSHLKLLNIITSAKSFLPFKVAYSLRFGGFGHGHEGHGQAGVLGFTMVTDKLGQLIFLNISWRGNTFNWILLAWTNVSLEGISMANKIKKRVWIASSPSLKFIINAWNKQKGNKYVKNPKHWLSNVYKSPKCI